MIFQVAQTIIKPPSEGKRKDALLMEHLSLHYCFKNAFSEGDFAVSRLQASLSSEGLIPSSGSSHNFHKNCSLSADTIFSLNVLPPKKFQP